MFIFNRNAITMSIGDWWTTNKSTKFDYNERVRECVFECILGSYFNTGVSYGKAYNVIMDIHIKINFWMILEQWYNIFIVTLFEFDSLKPKAESYESTTVIINR